MICPLPMYSATWWIEPGAGTPEDEVARAELPTPIRVLCWNWATDQCGSDLPPGRQAIIVRPEQSNEFGPAAAPEVGLAQLRLGVGDRALRAGCRVRAVTPLTGGAGVDVAATGRDPRGLAVVLCLGVVAPGQTSRRAPTPWRSAACAGLGLLARLRPARPRRPSPARSAPCACWRLPASSTEMFWASASAWTSCFASAPRSGRRRRQRRWRPPRRRRAARVPPRRGTPGASRPWPPSWRRPWRRADRLAEVVVGRLHGVAGALHDAVAVHQALGALVAHHRGGAVQLGAVLVALGDEGDDAGPLVLDGFLGLLLLGLGLAHGLLGLGEAATWRRCRPPQRCWRRVLPAAVARWRRRARPRAGRRSAACWPRRHGPGPPASGWAPGRASGPHSRLRPVGGSERGSWRLPGPCGTRGALRCPLRRGSRAASPRRRQNRL